VTPTHLLGLFNRYCRHGSSRAQAEAAGRGWRRSPTNRTASTASAARNQIRSRRSLPRARAPAANTTASAPVKPSGVGPFGSGARPGGG
jgi:hypothetical protein